MLHITGTILAPLMHERRIEQSEFLMLPFDRNDEYQLWAHNSSAAVTYFPNPEELHIWLMAGTLEDAELVLPEIERYAKDHGAKHIALMGRPGWSRSFLTQHAGYRTGSIELVKDL